MFSKYNIDTVLTEVFSPGVDKEALDVHHFMRNLSEETLLVVARYLRNS